MSRTSESLQRVSTRKQSQSVSTLKSLDRESTVIMEPEAPAQDPAQDLVQEPPQDPLQETLQDPPQDLPQDPSPSPPSDTPQDRLAEKPKPHLKKRASFCGWTVAGPKSGPIRRIGRLFQEKFRSNIGLMIQVFFTQATLRDLRVGLLLWIRLCRIALEE